MVVRVHLPQIRGSGQRSVSAVPVQRELGFVDQRVGRDEIDARDGLRRCRLEYHIQGVVPVEIPLFDNRAWHSRKSDGELLCRRFGGDPARAVENAFPVVHLSGCIGRQRLRSLHPHHLGRYPEARGRESRRGEWGVPRRQLDGIPTCHPAGEDSKFRTASASKAVLIKRM